MAAERWETAALAPSGCLDNGRLVPPCRPCALPLRLAREWTALRDHGSRNFRKFHGFRARRRGWFREVRVRLTPYGSGKVLPRVPRAPPAALRLRPSVERAAHAHGTTVEDVGVNHGGADVAVAEELLDRADVVAGLEQVRGEAVAEGVAGGSFCALNEARVRVHAPARSLV